VAHLRRIFFVFPLPPLVEDGSPDGVQRCEIYAHHVQFTRPLVLHVVVPRAWEREFSRSSLSSFILFLTLVLGGSFVGSPGRRNGGVGTGSLLMENLPVKAGMLASPFASKECLQILVS
jgi:hypothetical protein